MLHQLARLAVLKGILLLVGGSECEHDRRPGNSEGCDEMAVSSLLRLLRAVVWLDGSARQSLSNRNMVQPGGRWHHARNL